MPKATSIDTTPRARRRRRGPAPAIATGGDAAFLQASAAYDAAMAEQAAVTKALSAAPLRSDGAHMAALDDRCRLAVDAQFSALHDAAQAAGVVTPGGRRARAELLLRALQDLAQEGGELELDGPEMLLARAVVRDALS